MINFLFTTLSLWYLSRHSHEVISELEANQAADDRGSPLRILSYLNDTQQCIQTTIDTIEGVYYNSATIVGLTHSNDTLSCPFYTQSDGKDRDDTHSQRHQHMVHHPDLGIIVSCSDIMEGEKGVRSLIDSASQLSTLYRNTHSSDWSVEWVPEINITQSCVLWSYEKKIAWIYADLGGTTPIFFSLMTVFPSTGKAEAVITTDLLLGYQLGFEDLTAVGPGQILAIDVENQEINFIYQGLLKHGRLSSLSQSSFSVNEYSSLVFQSVQASVNQLVSRCSSFQYNDVVVTEVDEMFWTSKLLDCALDKLQIERLVRVIPPQVIEPQFSAMPLGLQKLSRYFPTHISDATLNKRKISFRQRAMDRWHFCHNPHGRNYTRKFYSYYTGMEMRVKEVYLQNLFCSLHGVKIIYPFASFHIQQLIHLANIAALGYVNKAVSVLISNGTCHNSGRMVRSISDSDIPCELSGHCFHHLLFYNGERRVEVTNKTEIASIISYDRTATPIPLLLNDSSRNSSGEAMRYRRELTLRKLRSIADTHATVDQHVVLLLATGGYYSLLHNFLCYIERIPRTQHSNHSNYFLPLIVVTSDREIEELALSFHAGVFNTQDVYEITHFYLLTAEFGTLQYQQLMLARTEIAMELLLLGFSPVVADIDTVWLENPLSQLSSKSLLSPELERVLSTSPIRAVVQVNATSPYDIAITDDDGEVCGCFVAINPTSRGIAFWQTMLQAHRSLVKQAIERDSKLRSFTDSEQKLLTKFIYGHHYKENLRYRLLSNESFPSGKVYFNQPWLLKDTKQREDSSINSSSGISQSDRSFNIVENSSDSTSLSVKSSVMIVHNNFVIGLENKIYRFEKRRLWMYRPPYAQPSFGANNDSNKNHSHTHSYNRLGHSHLYFGKQYCIDPKEYRKWSEFFSVDQSVSFNDGYLGLDVITPVHNTLLSENKTQVIMAVVESPSQEWSSFHNVSSFTSSVNIDPPSHVAFYDVFLGEKSAKKAEVVGYLQKLKSYANFQVSTDLAVKKRHFMVDFDGKLDPVVANENALKFALQGHYNDNHVDVSSQRTIRSSVEGLIRFTQSDAALSNMTYTVKILAFNRPRSLKRLLESLSKVDFHYYNFDPIRQGQISLEFLIDYNRTVKESILVQETLSVAKGYNWTWGHKKITLRKHNYGTLNQWLHAWKPVDENEIAIILEDDLVVSPFYFQWLRRAVDKYYRFDSEQRRIHQRLMDTVKSRIGAYQQAIRNSLNSSQNSDDLSNSSFKARYRNSKLYRFYDFDAFQQQYGGQPIMFGLCLQRQNLDPLRPNGRLSLNTAHRPFLYSLVGSWGPAMFPKIWHAFREWMIWRSITDEDFNPLLRDSSVTNYYFKNNPDIWTPFFIKFTATFGLKCLYPNLPGNLTLVNNFREAGENYAITLGAYASLVDTDLIAAMNITNNVAPEPGTTSDVIDQAVAADSRDDLERQHRVRLKDLRMSLLQLPSIQALSRWQYDLNSRRFGILGSGSSFAFSVHSENIRNGSLLKSLALSIIESHREFYDALIPLYEHQTYSYRGIPVLSVDHWVEVMNLLEQVLQPHSGIVHLEANPLPWMMIASDSSESTYQHVVISNNTAVSNALNKRLSDLVSDDRFSSVYLHNNFTSLSLEHEAVTCVVLYLELLKPLELHKILERIQFPSSIEYVLVIDECSSAPYSIGLPFNSSIRATQSVQLQTLEFLAVKQLCDVSPVEHGAVLYRRKDLLEVESVEALVMRNTTSRRLAKSLFDRSLILF